MAYSKEQHKRWKYSNGDTTCKYGQAPDTSKHMLQCPLLAHPCTLDDLQKFNVNARQCVDKWKNAFDDTKLEDSILCIIYEQSRPQHKQHCTIHGNAPKCYGSFLRPKTHMQDTYSQQISTRTQGSTNNIITTTTGWGKQKATFMNIDNNNNIYLKSNIHFT